MADAYRPRQVTLSYQIMCHAAGHPAGDGKAERACQRYRPMRLTDRDHPCDDVQRICRQRVAGQQRRAHRADRIPTLGMLTMPAADFKSGTNLILTAAACRWLSSRPDESPSRKSMRLRSLFMA
jgi:hypothetical protein